MSPEFSVLMSVYHKEKADAYGQCLQSLYEQTMPATEVVIVHDGPIGDDLLAVEQAFQARLPLVIVPLPDNVGLGRALQIGLEHCRFELIARMDADDICLPVRFAEQLKAFADDPELSVCGTWISEFSDGDVSQVYAERRTPVTPADVAQYIKFRNPLNHMTVMYRKTDVLAVGGYQHLLYMEDYYLWLRMFLAGKKIMNIPRVLVKVHAGTAMLARRSGWKYLKSERQLLQFKLKNKLITWRQYLILLLLRASVRLMPKNWRKLLYKLLRQRF